MQEFKEQWHFEGLYVADSALYSEANRHQLSGLRWLTRVPLSLTAASELVSGLAESALVSTKLERYRIATVCGNYGDVQQRWFVVERMEKVGPEAVREDDSACNQAMERATETQLKGQLKQLCTQEFACEADAIAALKQLEQNRTWHHLETMGVKPKLHYEKPGKPKPGTEPSRITYHP